MKILILNTSPGEDQSASFPVKRVKNEINQKASNLMGVKHYPGKKK